ncbi:hypothetical protein GJAV_G00201860 [Gymnothorax javanicus]|nr:hypothetical protein GJAV_G00201860 [Gymnothorax javanicus]
MVLPENISLFHRQIPHKPFPAAKRIKNGFIMCRAGSLRLNDLSGAPSPRPFPGLLLRWSCPSRRGSPGAAVWAPRGGEHAARGGRGEVIAWPTVYAETGK